MSLELSSQDTSHIGESDPNQSINQPINHVVLSFEGDQHRRSFIRSPNQSYQSINQSVNQPIDQSTYQSFNQSINQPVDQSTYQSIEQFIDGDRADDPSIIAMPFEANNTPYIGPSINQSIYQSIGPRAYEEQDIPSLDLNELSNNRSPNLSFNRSINQSANPLFLSPSYNRGILSPNQSINQSNNPVMYPPPTPHQMSAFHHWSNNQSINQSINQSNKQSTGRIHHRHSRNQSIDRAIDQMTKRSSQRHSVSHVDDPSINQSINLPFNQLTSPHRHETYHSIFHRLIFKYLPAVFNPRPHRQTFSRRLDQSIRSTISFLIVSIIAIQSFSLDIFAVPYLATIFACVSTRSSIGAVVAIIDSQMKGVLAATVIDIILLACGLDQLVDGSLIAAVVLVLFATSIILSYCFHAPLARRFSLAMHSLTMVQMAISNMTPIYFPLQILLNMVIGFAVSFLLCLFPWPRLASDELLDRYQLALSSLSSTFSTIIRAYLSTEPIAPNILHGDAKSELDAVFASLSEMRRLQGEQAWECELWIMCFPWSLSLGSVILPDVDGIERLYWLLSNLAHTLSTLRYSSYHATFVQFLRDSFITFDHAQQEYLSLLANQSIIHSIPRIDRKKAMLDKAMAQMDDAYLLARRHVYGYTADIVKPSVDNKNPSDEHIATNPTSSPTVQPSNTSNATLSPGPAVAESAQKQNNKPPTLRSSSPSLNHSENRKNSLPGSPVHRSINHSSSQSTTHPTSKSVQLFHSTQEVFVRSSFFFYVQRYHEVIQQLKLDHENSVNESTTYLPNGAIHQSVNHSAQHSHSRSTKRVTKSTRREFYHHKFRVMKQLWMKNLSHPLSWSLFGMHPLSDSLYLFTELIALCRHPSVNWMWLRISIKAGFTIAVASLISVIPGDNPILPNSVWLVFTAAIIQSESEGALVQRGMDRLFGTLIGCLIGYLILLAFPHSWIGSIGLMCLWNLPCQFVQASPRYAYLGALATFSSIVVVFGYHMSNPTHYSKEHFALSRMIEICIGVFIAILISSIIYPVSSIRLLRSEVGVSITAMKLAIEHTRDIYDQLITKQNTSTEQTVNQPIKPSIHPNAMSTIRSENQPEHDDHDDHLEQQAYQMADHTVRHSKPDMTVNQSINHQSIDTTITLNQSINQHPVIPPRERSTLNQSIIEELSESRDTPIHINPSSSDLLAQLLSDSACVQMSLTRQQRLLGEAVFEPAAFFHKFPASQYQEISSILRRLWRLILTLEHALRAVSDSDLPLPMSHFSLSLRAMIGDIDTVLSETFDVLQTGEISARWDFYTLTLRAQVLQSEFAHSMNALATRVRSGSLQLTPTRIIVPNAVLLHATLETSQLVLILEQAVRRLMKLERSEGYDD